MQCSRICMHLMDHIKTLILHLEQRILKYQIIKHSDFRNKEQFLTYKMLQLPRFNRFGLVRKEWKMLSLIQFVHIGLEQFVPTLILQSAWKKTLKTPRVKSNSIFGNCKWQPMAIFKIQLDHRSWKSIIWTIFEPIYFEFCSNFSAFGTP